MKKVLLVSAAVLLFASGLYAQAGFSTGTLIATMGEYGKIELQTPDSLYQLERASILVGTVADSVFDYQNDMEVVDPTILVVNPANSDFETYGAYDNAYSGDPPDVLVTQNMYGWNNGAYVILKFNIKNRQSNAINAMAGLDIIPYINENYGFDSVSYLTSEKVIRFHRGATTNMGMKLLSADLQSLYSFEWYSDYYVDSSYWNWMNFGSLQPLYVSNSSDGPVTITAQAPVSLAHNQSFDVYYAMAIGADQQAMLNNIAAAEVKYQTVFVGIEHFKSFGQELLLEPNTPNPFSQSTSISYQLPGTGKVVLKVCNAYGDEVATLVNGTQPKGTYTVQMNGKDLPAGVYVCMLLYGNQVRTQKLLVN